MMHDSGCVTVCVSQVKSGCGKKDRRLSRHVKCEHEQRATRCKICKANNRGGDSLCLHGRQQGWCLIMSALSCHIISERNFPISFRKNTWACIIVNSIVIIVVVVVSMIQQHLNHKQPQSQSQNPIVIFYAAIYEKWPSNF
jgi:hypothetical protein